MAASSLALLVVSFLAVTVSVALFAWWRTRQVDNSDARTYFLANRGLPWIQVAGSLLLTNISTEQLVGLNGAASIHGAAVMAWEVMSVIGLLALAWYFLPRYWSGNIATVPEFVEQRFDRGARRILSAILLTALIFVALPFIVYSGGVAMSSIFQIPERFGIAPRSAFLLTTVAIGVIGGVYVVRGGMRAVALSGTIYGAGLLVGALLIPVFALAKLGHGDALAGLALVRETHAARFNPIGAETANIPFSTLFSGLLMVSVYYWCSNQSIVQRSFGAKSFAEAQKGVLATAGLKLLGPFYLVLPGLIAAKVFGAAIGNGDFAYPQLVAFALPEALTGIFAAILLGCVLSAFNGGLHSAATVAAIDFYRAWLRPDAGEQATVRAGKIFAVATCVVVVICSNVLGNAPEGIFTMIKRTMAAFNMPMLAVVAVGMLSRRAPAWSAKASLLLGPLVYLALYWTVGQGWGGWRIHWLHIAALNAVLLAGFMILAGAIDPAPSRAAATSGAERTGDLTPWRHMRLATGALLVASFGVYLLFWLWSHALP